MPEPAAGGVATEPRPAPQNPNTPVAKPVATEAQPGQIPQRESVLSRREELLNRADAEIDARRGAEHEQFLRSADPRAAAMYAEMHRESQGLPISTDKPGTVPAAQPAAPARTDATPAPAATPQLAADPLAEHIVQVNGVPMLRAVIDGREQHIPLDRARATLQKNLAADARLQEAARRKAELDARETALRQREQARVAPPAAPAVPAVSDADLDNEARGLVKSLLTEPEDRAAARMAGVLKKIRQAPIAPVDTQAIVNQAATVAEQRVVAREQNRDLVSGLAEYRRQYPDIAGDSDLNALADAKTTVVAQEHPDWTPAQIMCEAALRTRTWVTALRGGQPAPVPPAVPSVQLAASRQEAKEQLVPMPAARVAPGPAAAEDPNRELSGSEALNEIRKARGQPY